MTRNAGKWEEMNNGTNSIATPLSSQMTSQSGNGENGDEAPNRPFEQNGTPELLGLYRSLMKLSKMGPLTTKPARLLVQLIQELLLRGEKI